MSETNFQIIVDKDGETNALKYGNPVDYDAISRLRQEGYTVTVLKTENGETMPSTFLELQTYLDPFKPEKTFHHWSVYENITKTVRIAIQTPLITEVQQQQLDSCGMKLIDYVIEEVNSTTKETISTVSYKRGEF